VNNPEERADVPVLTQIVDDESGLVPPALGDAAVEALARQLEQAVLEHLGAEIDRVTGQALDAVRAELAVSVTQLVREAVAASVAKALAVPKRD
jgi:hypothetical protein